MSALNFINHLPQHLRSHDSEGKISQTPPLKNPNSPYEYKKIRCRYFPYILPLLLLAIFSIQAETIICIDGGGSKTILQAIDEHGNILPIMQKGITTDRIISGGSNINTLGKYGVKQVIATLFTDTYIDNQQLTQILPNCTLYACFAGIGNGENRTQVASLLEEMGVNPVKLQMLPDSEMALQLIEGDGAIFICGTGTICLGKKGGVFYRVGGLGRIIGDEGSGYQIGIQAIKAALADEYGWGQKTTLTNALKEYFGVDELKQLVRPINAGEILPGRIAAVAPIIFEQAFDNNDLVAQGIVDQAEKELCGMIQALVEKSDLTHCQIHLWGGIFKSPYAGYLVSALAQKVVLREIILVNQSNQNPALLYALARKKLPEPIANHPIIQR